MILPANDGHPVKRVQYATEVNHDKTKSSKEGGSPEKEFKDEALAPTPSCTTMHGPAMPRSALQMIQTVPRHTVRFHA